MWGQDRGTGYFNGAIGPFVNPELLLLPNTQDFSMLGEQQPLLKKFDYRERYTYIYVLKK